MSVWHRGVRNTGKNDRDKSNKSSQHVLRVGLSLSFDVLRPGKNLENRRPLQFLHFYRGLLGEKI